MESSRKINRQPNPQEGASILSQATFAYLFSTFAKGFHKDLEEEDIPKCLDIHTSRGLGDKLENAWKEELALEHPSLYRAARRVFAIEFIRLGFVCLFKELVLNISQPLALSQLMKYYTQTEPEISENEAYAYAGAIVGVSFLKVLVEHNYVLGLLRLGMKLRVSCCSLIYRKSLRLNKSVLDKTTIGQMINLLSNDVIRCDRAIVNAQMIWICPLQILVIFIILYNIADVTSTLGVLFMVAFVPFQMYLAKKASSFRLKTTLKTDERVCLMNEIVSGIQVIKMYAWEKPFARLVSVIRRLEISNVRTKSYIKCVMISFSGFVTRFSTFFAILTYVLLGNTLDAQYVFVVISFYNVLRQAMSRQFLRGITELAEVNVSISRIQKFLLNGETVAEVGHLPLDVNGDQNGNGVDSNPIYRHSLINDNSTANVELQSVSAKWSSKSSKDILHKVNFHAHQGQLVAIIGPVGSGKTSLFHAILKELPLHAGILNVKGTISYASQEPWVFAASVQQNILFGQPMDLERYRAVVSVCALEQDLTALPFGDKTLVGERGVKLSGGQKARVSLARAIYRKADIYLLDDPLSAVDTQVGKQLYEDCISKFLKSKCTILITHQLQYLQNVNRIFLVKDGKFTVCGTYDELRKSKTELTKQLFLNKEEVLPGCVETEHTSSKNNTFKEKKGPTQVKEHRSFGSISNDVYIAYFKAGGSVLMIVVGLLLFVLVQIAASGSDYFLTHWVNLEQRNTEPEMGLSDSTRKAYIYFYSGIISSVIILTLTATIFFYNYTMKASTTLHDNMFSNMIQAPMQFFKTNYSGRILNRFAKDMGSIDEFLPSELRSCIEMGIHVIGVSLLVSLVKPWMLLVTLIIFIVFYLLRIVYVRTSRNFKRLDGITQSPVFGHLAASLQGLATIRAHGVQNILVKEFDDLQDTHSSVCYLFLTCSRAFSFWLDLICVFYIASVTFSFFITKAEEYGGNVGLAITQAMSLTGRFQMGMRHWSELENQMTAVERVLEYTKLECEPERKKIIPSPKWPEEGFIKFTSVSMKYSATDPYVLKKLSLEIQPREKLGIVGRTGAGKSSLIYALFQLVETEGTISIDKIDITKVHLQSLRSKISIIPQEPVLFSGSLRDNLDPFQEYSDEDLWNALDEVDLQKSVADFSAGLNTKVVEGGSNFSVGQRQLICLARAILRKNKILVLDEATANIDPHTDIFIQATIRRKFADCTVITVAHRLQTIIDSDKVLVMEIGNVVEFDHPFLLLKNTKSLFYTMVEQTGPAMAQTLLNVAKHSFEEKLTEK